MHKLHLPRLGQTMEQGAILEWLKKEEEPYEIGDILYEFDSEKVTYQVEAKRPGTIQRIVVQTNVELPVGTVLAVVADPGESLSEAEIEAAVQEEKPHVVPVTEAASDTSGTEEKAPPAQASQSPKIKAMPKARVIAKKRGLDLSTISGTGKGGAITVEDVERAESAAAEKTPRIRERRPVAGIARSMADAVTRSWKEIPQFVQMVWVDARPLMNRRVVETSKIKQSHDIDLSLNDLIIHAVAEAVKDVPEVNSTFLGNEIILYDDVNLSVAIATDSGLIVPVIHKAQELSLGEMAQKVRDLSKKARSRALTAEDVRGGTITVSNLGMFGIEIGTPIITPPQAAIVFIGSIVEKPIITDDLIESRPTFGVAVAYDHRVLDGKTASKFTNAVKNRLETPIERMEEEAPTIGEAAGKVSTLARKLAGRKGIRLEGVKGTGVRGRIMQADVLNAVEQTVYSVKGWEASMDQVINTVAETIVKFPDLHATIDRNGVHIWSGQK